MAAEIIVTSAVARIDQRWCCDARRGPEGRGDVRFVGSGESRQRCCRRVLLLFLQGRGRAVRFGVEARRKQGAEGDRQMRSKKEEQNLLCVKGCVFAACGFTHSCVYGRSVVQSVRALSQPMSLYLDAVD